MSQRSSSRRKWIYPAAFAAVLLGVGLAFPDLALLAFVAVLIVYLIEPVVAFLSERGVRGLRLPRWGAVVSVYTAMLGATIGFGAIVAPVLAEEAAALSNEIPSMVRSAREEVLPRIDARMNSLRAVLHPETVTSAPLRGAEERVWDAVEEARLRALFASALTEEERVAYGAEGVPIEVARETTDGPAPLFTLRPGTDGQVHVLPGEDSVVVRPAEGGGWVIGAASETTADAGDGFGAAFTDSIDDALQSSGNEVSEVLRLGQKLVTKLVAALIGIFVTFMVAAFISMDVPRIVSFATSLFPPEDAPAVMRLLTRLNQGLSGVIRGQLAICVINAILTGIGLLLLDVKFALLLAVIAGVMSLIPIFGTILSTIPCVLLALTQGLGAAVLVVVWIIVIHFIEANILQPKIMGSTARIHPAVVILALLAGEHAMGVIGALVAVPIASVLQSLLFFARDEYARAGDDLDDAPGDTVEEGEASASTAPEDDAEPIRTPPADDPEEPVT